jgi:hypothetical protein
VTDRRAQKDDVQADLTTLSGKAETAVIRSLGAYSPAWTIGAKTSSGKINLSRVFCDRSDHSNGVPSFRLNR